MTVGRAAAANATADLVCGEGIIAIEADAEAFAQAIAFAAAEAVANASVDCFSCAPPLYPPIPQSPSLTLTTRSLSPPCCEMHVNHACRMHELAPLPARVPHTVPKSCRTLQPRPPRATHS